jgi:hypothetical protein
MIGEIIDHLGIQIYHEIGMPDGSVIVHADPKEDHWRSVELANHNVFRLDAHNQVIWQVTRVETIGQMNWEVANRQAKEKDPNCEGFYDPFTDMGNKFFKRRAIPEKPSSYSRLECNPTVEKIVFDTYAPGLLLGLRTRRWAYDLDPETGVATCTGEQLK